MGQIDRVKTSLSYIFRNNSDCYAETTDGREHQAMSEGKFIEVLSENRKTYDYLLEALEKAQKALEEIGINHAIPSRQRGNKHRSTTSICVEGLAVTAEAIKKAKESE